MEPQSLLGPKQERTPAHELGEGEALLGVGRNLGFGARGEKAEFVRGWGFRVGWLGKLPVIPTLWEAETGGS